MNHPWTLAEFEKQRPDQYSYTVNEIYKTNAKFKVVHAPVKSGKRSFPEIASLVNPSCLHVFITALNRRADKEQRKELTKYGIHVHTIFNRKSAESCVQYVMSALKEENGKKQVHLHLDELDYGCKHDQILSGVYYALKTEENVKFILYSATVDVVRPDFLNSNVVGFLDIKPFVPSPEVYYGVNKYIEEGKIVQSTPFIQRKDKRQTELTDQGKECMNRLLVDTYNKDKKQHIGVLRLPGRHEGIHDFRLLKENVQVITEFVSSFIQNSSQSEQEKEANLANGIKVMFVGSKLENVRWDDDIFWEKKFDLNIPVLIVICQVAGRSTEWKCHPYLSWFHTCRSDSTTVGTLIQDQERIVYYQTDYNKNNDITLYGNVNCALYSAGILPFEQLLRMTKKKLALTLNGKNSESFVIKTDIYDNWEDIPVKFTSKLKKEEYVSDKFVLKKHMSYVKVKDGKTLHHIVKVPDWEKFSEYEGMYMTDVRGSINNFLEWCFQEENTYKKIKSAKMRKPVWKKSELMKNVSLGVNKTNPVRINVFYDDDEKSSENYKFMVRFVDGTEPVSFKNNSMYNF